MEQTTAKYGVGNVAVPGYDATIGYPQIFMGTGYLAGGCSFKPYHVLDNNYSIADNAQDTFKVTPRLVLNYGLRYEFQSPYVEENNNESNFDVASEQILSPAAAIRAH